VVVVVGPQAAVNDVVHRAGEVGRDLLVSAGGKTDPDGRKTSPVSGFISPAMTFMRVDLPAPLRPSRQTRSPGSIWKLIFSRIAGPPKWRLTSSR